MRPPRLLINCIAFLIVGICTFPVHAQEAVFKEQYESAIKLYNEGEYDQAVDLYKSLIAQMPNFAAAYIGIGMSLKAKGAADEEVLYYYKTAVDQDPSNVQALEQLGRLYYSLERLDDAEKTFQKALSINPNLPSIFETLGWMKLLGKNSRPEQAVFYFKKALQSSQSPNLYFGLGISYFADNQRAKALEVITQLRGMGQNEYADRVEKAVRENRRVDIAQFSTSIHGGEKEAPFESTADVPTGMKVRLKEKLDDVRL